MTLKLNGSTSGYTAIDAPAAAGSNTLVLPTTNGSAGQVLQTDGNGNLSWVNKPTSEFDIWILSNGAADDQNPITGWARSTSSTATYVGTGMSHSSGVFTFPSTGKWHIKYHAGVKGDNIAEVRSKSYIDVSTDSGSNWTTITRSYATFHASGMATYEGADTDDVMDVTNASTFRVRFGIEFSNSSAEVMGASNTTYTYVIFHKLAET